MAEEIHVNDVGTAFECVVKDEEGAIIDLSTATSLLMWFKRPDETTIEKTADLVNDGTDGLMQYVTEEGFLDQAGGWKYQGVAEFGATRWHSNIIKVKIYANLRSDS